ncbi:putative membrane protein [Actimicrobium sp. GrIS 1.19]|uniref:LapA family protein n=1 Tax=Actimicrobium sp. GrIS 1.19 TaxID=3071708 RepID=UPI002E0CE52C|nr:putative membrane protein [Actimicrobium sp. GrIS 1.19]
MKFLLKLLSAFVAIVFFGFALKNTQEAALSFFLGYEIRGPLVLLLFGFFLIGAVLGIVGMLPSFVRHRRELSRQKNVISTMMHEQEAQRAMRTQQPQPDSIVTK